MKLTYENIPQIAISIDTKRVDMMKTVFDYHHLPQPEIFWGSRFINFRGDENCTISHTEAVKLAKIRQYDHVIIYEDDAYPQIGANERLTNLLQSVPDDYNMILLGWSKSSKYVDFSKDINLLKGGVCGSHAYLINSSFYNNFLNFFYESKTVPPSLAKLIPVDLAFEKMNQRYGKIYILKSPVFIQHCFDKSMNQHTGYLFRPPGKTGGFENSGKPPKGFPKIEDIIEWKKQISENTSSL